MYILTGVGAIFKAGGPTNAKARRGPNGVKRSVRAAMLLVPPDFKVGGRLLLLWPWSLSLPAAELFQNNIPQVRPDLHLPTAYFLWHVNEEEYIIGFVPTLVISFGQKNRFFLTYAIHLTCASASSISWNCALVCSTIIGMLDLPASPHTTCWADYHQRTQLATGHCAQ